MIEILLAIALQNSSKLTEAIITKYMIRPVEIQGSVNKYVLDEFSGLIFGFSDDAASKLAKIDFRLMFANRNKSILQGEWSCLKIYPLYSSTKLVDIQSVDNFGFYKYFTRQLDNPIELCFLYNHRMLFMLHHIQLCFVDEADLLDVKAGKGIDAGVLNQYYISFGDILIGWHSVKKKMLGCIIIGIRKK